VLQRVAEKASYGSLPAQGKSRKRDGWLFGLLLCVAVCWMCGCLACCSVLQCVAVCCSVMQCVAVLAPCESLPTQSKRCSGDV